MQKKDGAMEKDLILTGWSKNSYLAAAAVALAALDGKADVAGVSMNALAGALADRAAKYSAVYVLGVGLVKNIPSILEALKSLKQKHVKSVWLSGMPVAPEFAAEVCIDGEDPAKRGFDELVDTPSDSLVDVVARYFGTLDDDDVRFFRAYEQPAKDPESAVAKYQYLIRVSGYMHRTRGDDSVYETAIRSLCMRVKPERWSAPSRGSASRRRSARARRFRRGEATRRSRTPGRSVRATRGSAASSARRFRRRPPR